MSWNLILISLRQCHGFEREKAFSLKHICRLHWLRWPVKCIAMHIAAVARSPVALYLIGCEYIIHVQTNEEENRHSHRHVTRALRNRTALLCLSTADLVFVGALFKAPFRTLSENRSWIFNRKSGKALCATLIKLVNDIFI